ncbi:MAG: tetratricopeptide repeat protein [Deltaproteobacteria bacterium]|nr:tetratricopeptide repeat protein [Deltaproteobacteria bacterium]MBW2065387.1 tetratricopeptide repeat protein [Deltaproteobacteria bacterium]
MKRPRSILCFLVMFVLLSVPARALSGEVILDSDDLFRFALETLEKGEYMRAITEFERFIHFFPRDERVPKARYLVGFCYVGEKKYSLARKTLGHVYEKYPGHDLGGRALLLIGETYYLQGVLGEAERCLQGVIEAYPSPELRSAAYYRLGWVRLKSNQWTEASNAFRMVREESPLYPSARDLAKVAPSGEALPRKSPAQAGVLAAILPGLGHGYSNRYKDGFVALLLNGAFIWASIEAFDEDLNVLAGILLALELGWYSGNIYSAVNSAHKYNRKVREDFRRNLTDRFHFNLFRTSRGNVGLAIAYQF